MALLFGVCESCDTEVCLLLALTRTGWQSSSKCKGSSGKMPGVVSLVCSWAIGTKIWIGVGYCRIGQFCEINCNCEIETCADVTRCCAWAKRKGDSEQTTLNSRHLGSRKTDTPDVKSCRVMSWGGGWRWGHSSWDYDSSWDWRNDGWQSWNWDEPEDLGSYTYVGSCNKSNGALPCQKLKCSLRCWLRWRPARESQASCQCTSGPRLSWAPCGGYSVASWIASGGCLPILILLWSLLAFRCSILAYNLCHYIRKAWGKSVMGPTNSINLF